MEILTVQQLIDELQKVENKGSRIHYWDKFDQCSYGITNTVKWDNQLIFLKTDDNAEY